MRANLGARASGMLTRMLTGRTGAWRLDILRGYAGRSAVRLRLTADRALNSSRCYAAGASRSDAHRAFHSRTGLVASLMICLFLLFGGTRTTCAQIAPPPLPVDPTPLAALL